MKKTKQPSFLEIMAQEKKESNFLSSIQQNISNIIEERKKISIQIETLLDKNISKKELLEILQANTFLSKYDLNTMIEEYQFNKVNNLKHKNNLSYNEIKIVKKIFKIKKLSKEEQIIFLQLDNLKEMIINEYQTTLHIENKVYNHTITFDEEGEETLNVVKSLIEEKLNKKISISELMYYGLIELYSSNQN